eukprot:3972109-Pleurochrysis_carterae.AAC.5
MVQGRLRIKTHALFTWLLLRPIHFNARFVRNPSLLLDMHTSFLGHSDLAHGSVKKQGFVTP